MSNFLITNISWKRKDDRFYPIMEWFNLFSNNFQKIELTNYKFSFLKHEYKFCIGFYDEKSGRMLCPNKKIIDKKYDRCFECESRNQLKNVLFHGHEPTHQKLKDYFGAPHLIYLAYFYPDIIKVGTVNSKRGATRLIEQDAQAFAFFARAENANAAWEYEKYLALNFDLKFSVKSSQKFTYINRKPDLIKVRKILKSKINVILKNADLIDGITFEFEGVQSFADDDIIFYPEFVPALVKSSKFTGTFKGLRGDFMILEQNEQLYAYSKKDLIGYIVSYV